MRHIATLIAAVFIGPLTWILIAFGQDRTQDAFSKATDTGAFHTDDFIRPLIYLAAAGLAAGLIATLRFSPLGAVATGAVYVASYAWLLVDPKSLLDLFDRDLNVLGQTADPATPVRTGTTLVVGALLLVSVFSAERWRRRPRPAPAAETASAAQTPAVDEASAAAHHETTPTRSDETTPTAIDQSPTTVPTGTEDTKAAPDVAGAPSAQDSAPATAAPAKAGTRKAGGTRARKSTVGSVVASAPKPAVPAQPAVPSIDSTGDDPAAVEAAEPTPAEPTPAEPTPAEPAPGEPAVAATATEPTATEPAATEPTAAGTRPGDGKSKAKGSAWATPPREKSKR